MGKSGVVEKERERTEEKIKKKGKKKAEKSYLLSVTLTNKWKRVMSEKKRSKKKKR